MSAARLDPRRLLLQVWLGSRGILGLVALGTMWAARRSLTDVVANWDVQHFYRLAREGYSHGTDPAFFPGLPLLLRGAALAHIPLDWAGLAISLVCSGLAAWALYLLADTDEGGMWAAALWLIAPTAVFTFVPYTESLFCALAFWAWERAKRGRWAEMAVLAAFACTVRVSGLFLVGALGVLILTRARERRGRGRVAPVDPVPLAWLALPISVLVGYAWYQYLRTGDWLAWYHAQSSGWARQLTWPWDAFRHTVDAIVPGASPDHPDWAWLFRGEMVAMVVGLIVTAVALARRRWAEAAWVGVQVFAFSVSYWFMSVNRAVLLWFPLWLMVGEYFASRRRGAVAEATRAGVAALWAVGSLAVMCLWAWAFYTGHWAS